MLKPNNILSYFIKDIKDPNECALYKQINTTNTIEIFYKDEKIYKLRHDRIMHNKLKTLTSYNYKNNVIIDYLSERIINSKIDSNKKFKFKTLFYKKDMKISKAYDNYVIYGFIYNKYLIKKDFNYVIEYKSVLSITIEYYNGYKYLYTNINNFKYESGQILIMNKYEANYINRFFSIYN